MGAILVLGSALTIYGTLNDSLGTVKILTTAAIIGGTVEGELSYTNRRVVYTLVGNVLFYEVHVSVNEVITHPEGDMFLVLGIPELKTRNIAGSNMCGFTIGYANGGYKESLRRVMHGNLCKDNDKGGKIALRLIRERDASVLSPALTAASFPANRNDVSSANNKVWLENEDGTTNVILIGSGVAILID